MIQSRRLLAFSSRVHTYFLLILFFLVLVYLGCDFFHINEDFVSLVILSENIIIWAIYLFSVWLLVLSFIVYYYSKVFPLKDFLLTLVRLALAIGFSAFFEVVEHVVHKGLTLSF
ncbi:MAG: hypothetical protein WC159_13270 [Sphaerochaetaceae bacterium]